MIFRLGYLVDLVEIALESHHFTMIATTSLKKAFLAHNLVVRAMEFN